MIAFLTLLVGLVVGPQTVEVAPPAATARLELRLDGETAARLAAPPWVATVDFGAVLAPRRLEAVAFDAAGTEIARTAQTVNLEPTPARLGLQLEGGADGRPASARLLWAAGGEAPESVALTLDGEPLGVDDAGSAELPPGLDPGRPHHLHAEATFAGTTLTAAAVFGGVFGSEAAAELTAVALGVRGRRLRRAHQVGDWLVAGGRPARVVAVDSGAADLVMVVDRSAWPELHAFGPELLLRLRATAGQRPDLPPGDATTALATPRHERLGFDDLRDGDRLYFVDPVPQASALAASTAAAGAPADLFQRTVASGRDNGALPFQLAALQLPDAGGPQALADAVAVAGRWAAAGGRPRAVVLVVGPAPADASRLPWAAVRDYLERLRVPLVVWQVRAEGRPVSPSELRRYGVRWETQPSAAGEASATPAAAARGEGAVAAWGPFDAEVRSLDALVAAASRLRSSLDRQRTVWIEGAYLPSEVELVAAPGWVSFAGQGDG